MDKLYAGLPDVRVPLNVFSSWGGLSCYIKLTSAPGTIIRLTVNILDMEPSDCIYDSLIVYDALLPMRAKTLHRFVFKLGSYSNIATNTWTSWIYSKEDIICSKCVCTVSVFFPVGCVRQYGFPSLSSPPLTSCCSPSDSRKATRASEGSSRPFLRRVCAYVCVRECEKGKHL